MSVFSMSKAVFTRVMFAVHSFVVIWRVTDVLNDNRYWFLTCGLILMCGEMFVTLHWRQGREFKWFCPSFFLYLCCVVPAIWFLEIDRLRRYRANTSGNSTMYQEEEIALSAIKGIKIPIVMSADMWVLSIEQSLLFLLIIGRWLLPKGDITHDQLSQLLFVYIGIASDIMEILILFDEEEVLKNDVLTYIILSLWSFSLLQYTLVLTATKARKPRVTYRGEEGQTPKKADCCACCETELWSILITVVMQDGPFLTVRMYVIVNYNSFNYTILFYTCKNLLVILLQIYRLTIVALNARNEGKDESEIPKVVKFLGGKQLLVNRHGTGSNSEVVRNHIGHPRTTSRSQNTSPRTPARRRITLLINNFNFSSRLLRRGQRRDPRRGLWSLPNSPYETRRRVPRRGHWSLPSSPGLAGRRWPSGIPPMPPGKAPRASIDDL